MTPAPLRRFLWPRSLAGKAGVGALLAVGLLVSALLVARHYTSKRLAEARKLGERFGLSTDWKDLLGPEPPDHENAAMPLSTASVIAGKFLAEARQAVGVGPNVVPSGNRALLARFDELLQNKEYEALLHEADARSAYRSIPTKAAPTLASTNGAREIALAEVASGVRLGALGRRDEAVRRLLRFSRLARKWEGKEPFSSSAVFGAAFRIQGINALNTVLREPSSLSPQLHDQIDAEMAEYESVLRILPWVAQTDMLAWADEFRRRPVFDSPLAGLVEDHRLALMLRNGYRMAGAWERPFLEAKREAQTLIRNARQRDRDLFGYDIGAQSDLIITSLSLAHASLTRMIAKARCLRVVNAWARRGDVDAALDSLNLPASCLLDPFDGNRLRVKRLPAGPIVYAVDQDLRDDGGVFEAPTAMNFEPATPPDVGLAPITKAATK